jgi:hypothetical protein
MALADWTLMELGTCMERAARQLRDPVTAGKLLDQARKDTPLVADILHLIAVTTASGPHRGRNRELEPMRRDLLLFLALRELEQEELAAARVRRVSGN